ncbi:MAG: anthranilate phosphoribosyltransferase [Wenzhouxiangellaceae bacterium]
MSMATALHELAQAQDLDGPVMEAAMSEIMDGVVSQIQIAGFLMALAAKGETVTEIAAAARVMRRYAIPVPVSGEHVLDTCGTGGDGASTFNISTAVAFVAAEGGARVAKHGNRSVSSRSGSADVLECAGLNLQLDANQVKLCIEQHGVGFLFAPAHHQATRHAVPVRRELGVRTLFNLLGPLTNPAAAPHQLLGVFHPRWLRPVAETLAALGSRHVLVVHAEDGLDEISLAAPTQVCELHNGDIREYAIRPEDFDIASQSLTGLAVSEPRESLAMIEQALQGKAGPARDIVALNAGAALYAADCSEDLAAGVKRASEILDSGAAWQRWQALIDLSQKL